MTHPALSEAIGNALKLKCPNCAKSKLYKSYLKQVDVCDNCAIKWSEVRADDGPAWLTIMIVGHIVAPLAVWVAVMSELPSWQIIALLVVASIVLTLAVLPFSKALFIAFIWNTKSGN